MRFLATHTHAGHELRFWVEMPTGWAADARRRHRSPLGQYPGLYGDLSARSGYNALTRVPAFGPDWLGRHRDRVRRECPRATSRLTPHALD